VTDDRALKRAIRRRMELTGEKYTDARRALAGGPGDAPRYPWLYAPFWVQLRERYERLCDEEDEAVARATVYGVMHSRHLVFALGSFQMISGGRGPSGPDDWLGQRPAAEYNAATIEASAPLAACGFEAQIERNRMIVDRVVALIDTWSAAASQPARQAAEARRASIGVRRPPAASPEATRPPGEPTRVRPRPAGHRSQDVGHEFVRDARHHFLRSPASDSVRSARRGVADPILLRLLDAWIDELERNYAALVDGMPAAWLEHGELELQAVADDPDQPDDMLSIGLGFQTPARMRVEQRLRGQLAAHEPVATPMLVTAHRLSPQPDGIAVGAPAERWHIRGHRLADGTVMPCLGSHRVSAAAPEGPDVRRREGERPRRNALFTYAGFSADALQRVDATAVLARAENAPATPEHLRRALASASAAQLAGSRTSGRGVFTPELMTVLVRAWEMADGKVDCATLAAALEP